MEYYWPSEESKSREVFLHGNKLELLIEKYGALSQNPESLFSRICIVNSCVTLEPYRGCPLDCVYCAANNDIRSINLNACNHKDIKIRVPEKIFSTRELLAALMAHPAFIKDKTILSFCSGSTEIFYPNIADDVWKAMRYLVDVGLKNPIWLIVKSFNLENKNLWIQRLKFLIDNKIKVIISISDAGLPREYEPYQVKNRFYIFKEFADMGVFLSHHLRPLFVYESVLDGIKASLEKSIDIVSSICVGGLRYDPGMNYYWKKGNISEKDILPGNQYKELPSYLFQYIKKIIDGKLPLFVYSSEMLSYYIGIEDYGLHQYRDGIEKFELDFSKMKEIDFKYLCAEFEKIASRIGLNIHFYVNGKKIMVYEYIPTQVVNALYQAIGLSGFWQNFVKNNNIDSK